MTCDMIHPMAQLISYRKTHHHQHICRGTLLTLTEKKKRRWRVGIGGDGCTSFIDGHNSIAYNKIPFISLFHFIISGDALVFQLLNEH